MSLIDHFEKAIADAHSRIAFGLAKDGDSATMEPFDPVTLLNGLIEAEIPFPEVIGLWQATIKKLETFNEMPHITERQLHQVVARFILQYSNADAAEWVSRYTDIYHSTIEDPDEFASPEADDNRVVTARSASVVKRVVEDFLCGEFQVDRSLLHELIDSREIVEMTNRMVRIVRFTGLQTVRLGTLRSMVSDTARFSQKSIVPAIVHDNTAALRQLEAAEAAFRASLRILETDQLRGAVQYQLALELLSRLFLLACVIPPYIARRQSFHRLTHLLSAVFKFTQHRSNAEPSIPLAVRRLESKLATQVANTGHLANRLVNATRTLSFKHSGVVDLREDAIRIDDSFREVLSLARELYNGAFGIGAISTALRAEPGERPGKLIDVLRHFADQELLLGNARVTVAGLEGIRIKNLSDLRQHAECLRFANHALFLIWERSALAPGNAAAIADVVSAIDISANEVGILLLPEEPGEELRWALQSRYRNVSDRALLWMDPHATARMFSRREQFLSELDRLLTKAEVKQQPLVVAKHEVCVEPFGMYRSAVQPARLFMCYSHRDVRWRGFLETHLQPYVENNKVDLWADTLIKPGEDWYEKIATAIGWANSAILLVSPEFLQSEFVAHDELPRLLGAARTRGLKIFWLYLSQCSVEETWIRRYQAVHDISTPLDALSRAKRNKALTMICKTICGSR